jgi:hypothetical protein
MVISILEISTYIGNSPGAIHYYGRLWIQDVDDTNPNRDDVQIKLTRKLTGKEVRAENLEAGYTRVRKGSTTEGFMTRGEVITAGLKHFKSHYQGVLIEGQYACLSAWQNLIYWSPCFDKIATEMNALAKEFQSLNGYEGDEEKRVEQLDKRWYTLYSTLILKCKTPIH